MRKLLLIVILVAAVYNGTVVSEALGMRLNSCSDDTKECRYENCEFENFSKNWPASTGYAEDCNKYLEENDRTAYALIATGLLASVAVSLFIVKNKMNPKKKQRATKKTRS